MQKIILSFALILALKLNAQALDHEDRLLDLEAQVNSLQSKLDAVKNTAEQERPSAFNPSMSVVVDLMGQYGFDPNAAEKAKHHAHAHPHAHAHAHGHGHGHKHEDKFLNGVFIREVALGFRGAIDPWADAMVELSVGQHGVGEDWHFHVEEAYARLKQWPGLNYAPLGIEIKAGMFKTAFGRMNRIHLHNIPHVTYPLALRAFLGEEGYAAAGLSLSTSFALAQKSALTVFLEGVMGSAVPMQQEGATKVPNAIAHAWFHQELADGHYLDLGASVLFGRRGEKESGLFTMLGGDLHYSYTPAGFGQDPLFLFGAEVFAADDKAQEPWALGGFTWAQTRLVGSSFVGVRWDVAPHEKKNKEHQHALGAYVGYYTTEFLRFRFGYEHVMPKFSSFAGDHRFMLSMNFVLGSHPVEPYFINR
jgi:hypothetical protein